MTNYAKLLLILTTTPLLVSWSNKFGSKEEALYAQWEFMDGGKEIVVLDIPTDDEVEKEISLVKAMREPICRTMKEHLRTGEVLGQPIDPYYLAIKRKKVREDCYPGAPIRVSKETLTKRKTYNTRTCNYEQETRAYVCKEWRVYGNEIMKEDWMKLKPKYSYFRF